VHVLFFPRITSRFGTSMHFILSDAVASAGMAHGRPSSVVGLVSGGVLEPKVPAGPKLHRVPGSSFRPGSTPWALHPLVVAEGDAPEFPE